MNTTNTSTTANPKIVGLFIFLVGAIFTFVIISVGIESNNLRKKCTANTTGTVISLEAHTSTRTTHSNGRTRHRTSTTYHPVYTFEVDGTTYQEESDIGTNPASYSVNESVTVHYNPNNPNENYIGDSEGLSVVLIIVAVITSLIAIAGAIMFISNFRR